MDNWYVEWDEAEIMYGVFHVDTGFCTGLFCDESEANKLANQLNGNGNEEN